MNHFAWFCLHFSMSAVFLPHHMMTRAACSVCWLPSVTLTVTQVEKAVETDLLYWRMCSDSVGISRFIYQNTKPLFPKQSSRIPTDCVNIWGKISLSQVGMTHLQHSRGNPHFCFCSDGRFHLKSLARNTRNSLWHPCTFTSLSLMSTELPSFFPVPTSFTSALPFESLLAPVLMCCWLCSKASPFFRWRIC